MTMLIATHDDGLRARWPTRSASCTRASSPSAARRRRCSRPRSARRPSASSAGCSRPKLTAAGTGAVRTPAPGSTSGPYGGPLRGGAAAHPRSRVPGERERAAALAAPRRQHAAAPSRLRRGGLPMADNRGVASHGAGKVEVQDIAYPTFELQDGPRQPGERRALAAPRGDPEGGLDEHLRLRPAHGPRRTTAPEGSSSGTRSPAR